MSRIGKKPIVVPNGVKVAVQGHRVAVTGPKGTLDFEVPVKLQVEATSDQVVVSRADSEKKSRELHGMARAMIANMVAGVQDGFQKRLLIFGTGYGCNLKGQKLELNLGYMGRSVNKGPQFSIDVPSGVEVIVEAPAARGETDPAKLLIKGIDKQKVHQFAAEIRALRKPEPYKGKGVRYEDEHVQRKQGKALTSGG